jgi:hypothetical protein
MDAKNVLFVLWIIIAIAVGYKIFPSAWTLIPVALAIVGGLALMLKFIKDTKNEELHIH